MVRLSGEGVHRIKKKRDFRAWECWMWSVLPVEGLTLRFPASKTPERNSELGISSRACSWSRPERSLPPSPGGEETLLPHPTTKYSRESGA